VEGDPAETEALLAVLATAGVEVQVGARKRRAEGFTHTYAMARLQNWPPADADPIRVPAYIDRPALPAGGRRPARRPQ
jgi:hypothetical protein